MEYRFIDKTFYNEISDLTYDIASAHVQMRPDIFPKVKKMTKKQFKKRIKMKGFLGIAAYENNILCGYCFCRVKNFSSKLNGNSRALWIDEFYICKEFRRHGYGKMLFEEIKKLHLINPAI